MAAEGTPQLQLIADALQELANRLSMEGRFLDAATVVGGLQTIRGLWTRLNPPPAVEAPPPPNGETRPRLEAVD